MDWVKNNKIFTIMLVVVILGWLFDRGTWMKKETDLNKEVATESKENTELKQEITQHKNKITELYDANGKLVKKVSEITDTNTNTNENSNSSNETDLKESEKQKIEEGKIPKVLVYGGTQIGNWTKAEVGGHYRLLGNLNAGLQVQGDMATIFSVKPDMAVFLTVGQQF